MQHDRPMPALVWSAVLAGVAVALASGLAVFSVATLLGAPILGFAASFLGCALGAFVAGKRAQRAGWYHGAVVGAAWVGLEAIGAVPTVVAGTAASTVQETLTIIAFDIALLIVSGVAGRAAT